MTDTPAMEKPLRRRSRAGGPQAQPTSSLRGPLGAAILEEAQRNGLLESGKSAHVSFRVPQALVDAARRETGIASVSELGTLALAMLAQPDPVASVMKKNRGRLGREHTLDT